MEYNVYETKKYFRENKLKVLIFSLAAVAVIGLVYAAASESNSGPVAENPNTGGLRGTDNSVNPDAPTKRSEDSSSDNQNANDGPEVQKPTESKGTDNESKDVPVTPSKPIETRTISNYEIVETRIRPGTKQYYTQGLILKDQDTFIESTGLYGESVIHYVDRKTLKVGLETELGSQYFGEGCELVNLNGEQLIYQLTWRERKVFVWNAETLELKNTLALPNKIRAGWGITSRQEKDADGISKLYFYITDGSSQIFVVDAETFKIVRSFPVRNSDKRLVNNLNELEFIKGKIWANIYGPNTVAIIDPATGLIEAFLDLSKLEEMAKAKISELNLKWQRDYVMNGVAYDSQNDRVIITGKMWPIFWEIKVPDV